MNSLKPIKKPTLMLSTLWRRRSDHSQFKSLKNLITQMKSCSPKKLIKRRNPFKMLRNPFQKKSKKK